MTYQPNQQAELQTAIKAISSQCDGAIVRDGVGFNASDTTLGKSLALLPAILWDQDVAAAAWGMLSHYRAQLTALSIEFDKIDQVKPTTSEREGRRSAIHHAHAAVQSSKVSERSTLTLNASGVIILTSPYNGDLLKDVRAVAGRSWDAQHNVNRFPAESVRAVLDLAAKWNIPVPATIEALPDATLIDQTEADKEPEPLGLEIDDDKIIIRFPYHPDVNQDLRMMVTGSVFSSIGHCWKTDISNSIGALKFATKHGLTIQPGLAERIQKEEENQEELHVASMALDADIDIPSAIPLLPFQRAGVAYLLKTRRAILADEMGVGKTCQALAAAVVGGALPIVVVCPNTLKLNWKLEVEKFFPELSVTIVSGRSEADIEPADVIVVNYDIVDQRCEDIINLIPRVLIADEAHAIKNGEQKYQCPLCHCRCRVNSKHCTQCSQRFDKPEEIWTVRRTHGIMKLARAIPPDGMVMLLSGPPITNRPVELIPQLIAINRMDDFGGRWKFINRYAPGKTGAANLVELNDILRSRCFIRRLKKDVFDELPELRNAKQMMTIAPDKMAVYVKIEADVIEYLSNRARELAEEAGEDGRAAYWEKRMRAEAAEHLVRISALKNAVAELKYDAQIKWIEEFLEDSDEKIVVFAEHINTVEQVAAHFGNACVKIRGGVSQANRMAAVEWFQTDPTCRVFIGNMAAASKGVTLTAASNVAYLEQAWTSAVHAQCASRCYGRADSPHGATAWWLLAPRTIDEDIFTLLAAKEKVVNAATEGREVEKLGSVLADLLVGLAKRGLTNSDS